MKEHEIQVLNPFGPKIFKIQLSNDVVNKLINITDKLIVDKNREKSKFISKYLHDEVLSYKKTLTYMITLQEFLKSKNIKYLFYDPFVNILVKDDYYYEVIEKEKKRFISFPYKEEVVSIENIHEKIDKRFYFGPEIDGRCAIEGMNESDLHISPRHPNKKEHEWIAEVLYEKLNRIR